MQRRLAEDARAHGGSERASLPRAGERNHQYADHCGSGAGDGKRSAGHQRADAHRLIDDGAGQAQPVDRQAIDSVLSIH